MGTNFPSVTFLRQKHATSIVLDANSKHDMMWYVRCFKSTPFPNFVFDHIIKLSFSLGLIWAPKLAAIFQFINPLTFTDGSPIKVVDSTKDLWVISDIFFMPSSQCEVFFQARATILLIQHWVRCTYLPRILAYILTSYIRATKKTVQVSVSSFKENIKLVAWKQRPATSRRWLKRFEGINIPKV